MTEAKPRTKAFFEAMVEGIQHEMQRDSRVVVAFSSLRLGDGPHPGR